MMKTIKVSNPLVAEEIRKQIAVATITNKGFMDSSDRKRGFCWDYQIGNGKSLYVGRFPRGVSISFSAISGNGNTTTEAPTPQIIALSNHSSTGISKTKIGNGNKWVYIDDGNYINLYYRCSPYVGDGIFIISYSAVELIMEFVDTPINYIPI